MANGNLEARKDFIQSFIKQHPTCEAGGLYDALEKEWPNVSRGGHRSLVYRELDEAERPWERTHACPKCEVEAQGLEAIDATFGFRNMSDGKRRVQSWCRQCRKEDARKRRKKKAKAEAKAEKAKAKPKKKAKKAKAKKAEKPVEEKSVTEMTVAELQDQFTKKELKAKLDALDLKVGGNKPELAERLHAVVAG